MIDAHDLRDALIYGLENTIAHLQRRSLEERRGAYDEPQHAAFHRQNALILDDVTDALTELIAKLTGDWPPTKG